MQTRCIKCGDTFTCGADAGSCWCMDLPRVTPVPQDAEAGCLCRRCLMARQGLICGTRRHIQLRYLHRGEVIPPTGPAASAAGACR